METLGKIFIAAISIILGGSILLNLADYIYCKIKNKDKHD